MQAEAADGGDDCSETSGEQSAHYYRLRFWDGQESCSYDGDWGEVSCDFGTRLDAAINEYGELVQRDGAMTKNVGVILCEHIQHAFDGGSVLRADHALILASLGMSILPGLTGHLRKIGQEFPRNQYACAMDMSVVKSMHCQWRSKLLPAVFLVQMLPLLGGCREVDDPVCDGVVDLEAVVASRIAVDDFRVHVGKAGGDTEMARFFGDYRNYDLRFDATEST